MLILVLGKGKSGKSRFAEGLVSSLADGPLFYIATFVPVGDGEFGAKVVARHRAQREKYGFDTVERPFKVAETPLPKTAAVLLEDVSNLVANELFDSRGSGAASGVVDDVMALEKKSALLVAVSVTGLTNADGSDEGTKRFISQLNRINGELLELCDAAVEMRDGNAVTIKGKAVPGSCSMP